MDPDPLRQPPRDTLGNGLTVGNRGLVHHYQREVGRADLRKVVERGEDLRAPDPARGREKSASFARLSKPSAFKPLPTATGEFVGHPGRLPGIPDTRNPIKTRGIKVKKIDLTTGLGRL